MEEIIGSASMARFRTWRSRGCAKMESSIKPRVEDARVGWHESGIQASWGRRLGD